MMPLNKSERKRGHKERQSTTEDEIEDFEDAEMILQDGTNDRPTTRKSDRTRGKVIPRDRKDTGTRTSRSRHAPAIRARFNASEARSRKDAHMQTEGSEEEEQLEDDMNPPKQCSWNVEEQGDADDAEDAMEVDPSPNQRIKALQMSLIDSKQKTQAKNSARRQTALKKVFDEAKAQMNAGRTAGGKESLGVITDRTNDCLRRMDSMIEEMQTNLLKGDPSDSLNGPLESKPGLDDRLTFHLVECQKASESVVADLEMHLDHDLQSYGEIAVSTGRNIQSLPAFLHKARKRALKETERKSKEQVELAKRNLTARRYIQSVSRVMGASAGSLDIR